MISSLERDGQTVPLALRQGPNRLLGGVMAPPLALIDATTATSGRSVRCRDLDT